MSEGQLQFRCEPCNKVLAAAALVRNRWGDAICPDCGGVDLVVYRTRLAGIIATYFLFNVF